MILHKIFHSFIKLKLYNFKEFDEQLELTRSRIENKLFEKTKEI